MHVQNILYLFLPHLSDKRLVTLHLQLLPLDADYVGKMPASGAGIPRQTDTRLIVFAITGHIALWY